MRRLLLLALLHAAKADGECANWCTRWTCNNEAYCGGCDRSICRGPNPHRMCADVEQPYCGAPRCERWCQQDAHCERAECSGCDSCAGYVERGVATERPAASPFPAPVEGVAAIRAHEASPTCDENFLSGLRAELRSLVGAQTARNNEIRAALGLSTVEAAPPGEPRPPPPPHRVECRDGLPLVQRRLLGLPRGWAAIEIY